MFPGKHAPWSDPPHLQRAAILRFPYPRRIGAWRGRVHGTRSLLSQRFVRTLLVVLRAKAVKSPLLRLAMRRWWRRRLLLQRAMHALVSAILFRMSGRDA